MIVTKTDIVLSGRYKGLTVPAGTRVTECAKLGSFAADPATHYWVDEFAWIEKQTGFRDSLYKHDAVHYGITLTADQVQEAQA